MEITTIIKICAIPTYWILSFLSGLLPIKVEAVRNSVKWSGIANAFAGGIFLSLGLVHLLPEGTKLMNKGCGGE
jgi:zinc transporter 1/2/3